MPGQTESVTLEKNKTNYLNQDRSVNLQKHLDKQEKLEKSGLQNIEIRDRAKQLGKDDFLQLLVKQLTHQDPTSPIKDQAFIAQMAQFSSLEQMQNMAQSINKLSDRQAMDLVGKFIMGKDFVSGQPVTGVAQALFFDHSGQAFLKVSGKNVAIKDVNLIGDPKNFKREFGGTASAPVNAPGASMNAPGASMNAPGASVNASGASVNASGTRGTSQTPVDATATQPTNDGTQRPPMTVSPDNQKETGDKEMKTEQQKPIEPGHTGVQPKGNKPVGFVEMIENQPVTGGTFHA